MPDSHARLALSSLTLVCALCGPMAVSAAPAPPAPPAFRLGECRDTRVASVNMPVPPDRRVELTNGLTLHYYQENYRLYPLKLGQPVKVCLVNIATYCGSRQVNTRTYLLHQLHDAYRRRPQMLPDTVDPCARER